MANIDKIIKSKNLPRQTNVAWVDLSGETPVEKHFINGRWVAVSGGSGSIDISGKADKVDTPNVNHLVDIEDLTDEQVAGLRVGDMIEQGLEEENWKLVYYVYNIDEDGVVYLVSFQGNSQESTGTGTVFFWKLDKPITDSWELLPVDYISKTLAISVLPSGNAILPNVLYKLGTLANDASLTIRLATPTYSSIANVYTVTFDTDSIVPTIIWPNVTWCDGADTETVDGVVMPVIEPNKHYEVSIMDGYGIIISADIPQEEETEVEP